MTAIHQMRLRVANKPGVLLRITLVFSRRAVNIDELSVSEVSPGQSEMRITAYGAADVMTQIHKQVAKLIDVIQVDTVKKEQ